MVSVKKVLASLRKIENELRILGSISSLLQWDQQTLMPKAAIAQRQEHLAYVSKQMHLKVTSKEMQRIISFLSKNKKRLSFHDQLIVKKYRKELRKLRRIPVEHVEAFARLVGKSSAEWERARKENKFSIFAPYLKRIIQMRLKEARLIDRSKHPYDVLLDEYEEGTTIKDLERVFGKLKQGLRKVLKKVRSAKKKDVSVINISENEQKEMVRDIVNLIVPEEQRRVVAESVHPFTTEISADDVRLTTAYRKGKPLFAIEAAAHEAGHALYELSIPLTLRKSILGSGASTGIHESQSRLWENHVFKSREFWQGMLVRWRKKHQSVRKGGGDDWYQRVNRVQPSLVRIEADEVTYNLHVIIRYEIEREICEGKIRIEEIPKVWNKKYKEYLGVSPRNDVEGVLQDVHWAWGSFGYFPMYTLGNIYAAMLWKQLLKECKGVKGEIRKGNVSTVRTWLQKKVHAHGATLTAKELIKRVCKKGVDAEDFVEYINEKYGSLYKIKESGRA